MIPRFGVFLCLVLGAVPPVLHAAPLVDPLAPEVSTPVLLDESETVDADVEILAPRPAILAYAGEATPWTAYGVVAEFTDREFPFFVAAGAGRIHQSALQHAQEELDVKTLARSISAGGQWSPFSRFFAFRGGVGLTSFSGSFTQRGTDLAADPMASDLLGTGFGGHALHSSIASVFTHGWGRLRFEFVPVGFRFTLWRSITQDRETPHQVALNRYLGGNTVFGLVNLAIGISF